MTNVVPSDATTRALAVWSNRPDPLKPADEVNPQVSPAVAAVLQQAMALERHDRPATAAAMRQALRDAVNAPAAPVHATAPVPDEEQLRAHREAQFEARRRAEAETIRLADEEKQRREDEAQRQAARDRADAEATTRSLPAAVSPAAESKRVLPTAAGQTIASASGSPPPTLLSAHSLAAPADLSSSDPVNPQWDGAEPEINRSKGKRIAIAASVLVVIGLIIGIAVWRNRSATASAEMAGPTTTGSDQKTGGPVAPAGMAYVPGGKFMMGRDRAAGVDEFEIPAHPVTIKPFFIDLNEVTNEDYRKCVDAGKCTPPAGWVQRNFPSGTARHPVTGVAWSAANAYAKFAGQRLPTEEEWEFAARGTDRRLYPWGNDWQPGLANADGASSGIVDVGQFKGTSPFGALDMIGNAWEWTATDLRAYAGGQLSSGLSGSEKVIRGGSYKEKTANGQTTATYRGYLEPNSPKNDKTGFRCVQDIKP